MVDALMVFARKTPDKQVAVDARFMIVRLYLVKKDYAKALGALAQIKAAYQKFESVCAEAVFMEGQVWEEQGDWAQALTRYQEIMLVYFDTPRAMNVPVYIATHYKEKLQPDKMIDAYHDAVAYYEGLADKFPRSRLAFKCRTMAAQIHTDLKEWPDVIKALETAVVEFKDGSSADAMRIDMATIYNTKLNDTAKAQAILQEVVKNDPGSALANKAREMLDKISRTTSPAGAGALPGGVVP